jgi:hypothetical protein
VKLIHGPTFVTAVLVIAAASGVSCKSTNRAPANGAASTVNVDDSPVRERPIDRAIRDGVAYLVRTQNADGSWGTGRVTRGFEIYSMVPGSHDAFRVATTALAVMALREAGETAAHHRGVEYLASTGRAARDNGRILYNTWAHIYALQCLSIEMRHSDDPRIEESAMWHLDRLRRYETYVGGWNYYDFTAQTQQPAMPPTAFSTAAALLALWEARLSGIDVEQRMIDRAIKRVDEMRLPDGSYLYGTDYKYNPRLPANQMKGTLGRIQACNFALMLWGRDTVTQSMAADGFDWMMREHAWLNMARKRPMPHEAWYQNSGYYYYFGHYYAARLLERLEAPELAQRAAQLAEKVLPYQEEDGSWWDYAMWDYHKPYGTAYSVMTLLRIQKLTSAEAALAQPTGVRTNR